MNKERAYTQLGRWQQGISAMKGFAARHPDQVWPHYDLAVDYVELGRDQAACSEVAEILKLDPESSLQMGVEGEFPAQREGAVDLAKAGLK